MEWQELQTTEYINLQKTLFSGQIFTFTKTSENEYTGYLDHHIFIFKQAFTSIFYKTTHINPVEYLKSFFTLDINYNELIIKWTQIYPHPCLKNIGLRLLRIDCIEVILGFICSQNNNIKRITQMVIYLKEKSENFNINKLDYSIIDLQRNKFGYRARYIIDAVEKIKNIDLQFIRIINDKDYVMKFLMSIKGVGKKVCDCILLMGFGFYDVVPLDVHMIRMTKVLFGIDDNKKIDYSDVSLMYKNRFGPYCGIAQLFLFKFALDNKKIKLKKEEVELQC